MKLDIPGVGTIDENGKLIITDKEAQDDIEKQGFKIGKLDEIKEQTEKE